MIDGIGGARGQVPLSRGTVPPGERVHVSQAFMPESMGQRHLESECYNDAFRSDEVALLYIDLPHPTGQPVAFHIGNPRPIGRPPGEAGTGPRLPEEPNG